MTPFLEHFVEACIRQIGPEYVENRLWVPLSDDGTKQIAHRLSCFGITAQNGGKVTDDGGVDRGYLNLDTARRRARGAADGV